MDLLMLALLALAAARATYLVSDDQVPFGYIRDALSRPERTKAMRDWTRADQFRIWLKDGMDCTHCVSIHAGFWAAVLATYADWTPVEEWADWPTFMVTWFAISGAIVLLESVHFYLLGNTPTED